MRHLKSYRKLKRESSHRRALLRNMATSFLRDGKICTTEARAKELKPIAERIISCGKKGLLSHRRRIASFVYSESVAAKVLGELAKRFEDRPGGYTRLSRQKIRFGDGAPMCQLELVDYREHEGKVKAEKASETKKTED